MPKITQYNKQYEVRFKYYVCLRDEGADKNKPRVTFYFGAIFLEMQTLIFVQLMIFETVSPIFVSRCLTKS